MKHDALQRLLPLALLAACSAGPQGGDPSGNGSSTSNVSQGGAPIVGIAGKCLDDSGDQTADGNKIQLWDCNGTDAQNWTYTNGTFVGPGGKCLDVQWGNSAPGTVVQLWDCNGSAAQQWTISGKQIVGIGGMCLDDQWSGSQDGNQIQIWSCNGTAAQQWNVGGASSSPGSGFHVQNGQVIDPNGNTFVARGINVGSSQLGAASQILANFPGINFVRVAVSDPADPAQLPDPATFAQFIQTMTGQRVVVELEDHPWGSGPNPQPNPYTGQQLAEETSWYAAAAAMYQSNPYVWFGTMNEPEGDGDGVQAQISAIYDAIRGTGSNAIVMTEAGVGGGNPQTVGVGGGYGGQVADTQAGFAGMTNVVWDMHFYGGWGTNDTTDVSALQTALYGSASSNTGIAAAQSITDADGVIPVIIGETGIAATGISDGVQVLQAVFTDGQVSGAVAWGWYPDPSQTSDPGLSNADDLTDGNGNLSAYGEIVAGYIAQQ